MTPKYSPFLWWPPPKFPQNYQTPKNIYFSEPPPPKKKNTEIQNFDPQKMTLAYVCMKISEYPPGHYPCIWCRLLTFFLLLQTILFKEFFQNQYNKRDKSAKRIGFRPGPIFCWHFFMPLLSSKNQTFSKSLL